VIFVSFVVKNRTTILSAQGASLSLSEKVSSLLNAGFLKLWEIGDGQSADSLKAASRGIPLAAALQTLPPGSSFFWSAVASEARHRFEVRNNGARK
jgi:hypothetical protein